MIKRLWLIFAFATIFFAIVFSLFRGLTPWVGKYRPEIERRLSLMLGEDVHIGAMKTGWYWFEPMIMLRDIELTNNEQQKINLGQLFVGLDIPLSLWNWRWQPGIISIDDLQLSLQQTADGWLVKGLTNQASGFNTQEQHSIQWLMNWILNQKQTRLRHAHIRLYLLDGTVLPFDDINLLLQNHHERYTVKIDAKMGQTTPTSFVMQGTLFIDDAELDRAKGQLHFKVENMLPGQWQSFFVPKHLSILSGIGSGQFWLNIKDGTIHQGQAEFVTKNLVLKNRIKEKQTFLQSMDADLFWKQDQDGLFLTANRLNLRMDSVQWPENQMSLEYHTASQTADLRMRYFDASSLHSIAALTSWSLPELESTITRGDIQNMHLRWQSQQLQHVFGQFSNLGWRAFSHWPDVSGLSGVVQYAANQGRIRLDSRNVVMQFSQKPELQLNLLGLDIDWHRLNNKPLDIAIHDVSVCHPHFQLSASGHVQNANASSDPFVDVHGRFSAKDAEFWKPWLPVNYLKPKLLQWLQQDVKKLPQLVGAFDVQGQWQEFPYEAGNGMFRIELVGTDAELAIASGWPVANAINGSLLLQGRTLSGSIYHGWFGEVLLKHLNLQVNHLGSDNEVLMVHARIKSAAQKLVDYILQTPVHTHLKSMRNIKTKGMVNLDLQVEVPFYQGPEKILVLGDMQLPHNEVTVAFDGLPLVFSEVNGSIQFDQKGILDSQLDVNFWKLPLAIRMHSNSKGKPALLIEAGFPFDIDILQKQWPSPWWALLDGKTKVQANMRVTDDPDDLDHLQIQSHLQGLAIQLPPPFHKNASQRSSLDLAIDFNPHQGFFIKTQWSKLLGTHLWFALKDGAIQLKKGEIRIGSADASPNVDHGVQLLGRIPRLDDREWKSVFAIAAQTPTKTSLWSSIDFIDLLINKAHWFGQSMTKVNVQARRKEAVWDMQLQEKMVKATLRWNALSNAYDMHFNQLHIPEMHAQRSSVHWPAISPKQFPQMTLKVDHLYFKTTDLGQLQLQGEPVKEHWSLKRLHLDNSDYQLRAQGQWRVRQGKQDSEIDMGLTVSKLSSLLKRFGYPDVMQAKQGYVAFKGKWNGPLYDPQTDNVNGNLSFTFSNGVISELNKETEDKIGLGKMLSIFSLQTIPRRLRLDFSDLSNRGYSFDTMKGHFRLAKGILSTTDTNVNGPVAHASMKGRLNVKTRQCDLKLRITPHITASLPIVATIAGGPIAGVATWIVNKIVSREMEKVTGYTYLVKGHWAHPEIVQGNIITAR